MTSPYPSITESQPKYAMRYDQLIKSSEYNAAAKFAYYNQRCFNNALPDIPIRFVLMKNTGGLCACKYNKATNSVVPGSIKISLDKTFLRDEEALDGILVHEMIHAWFYINGDFKENHGMSFQEMRRKLSALVGFQIPTTEKVSNPVLADEAIRPYVVFVRSLKDGETVYFVATPDFAKKKADEYAACWQERKSYTDVGFAAYEITSPAWSQLASRTRLQRPKALWAAKYYILKDNALLDDLKANGRVLFSLMDK